MRPKPTGPTALPAMMVGPVDEVILGDIDIVQGLMFDVKKDVVGDVYTAV